MTAIEQKTIDLLNQNWVLLLRSLETLNLSVIKAESIGEKADYSFEELETFDSLTAKFSRTSDIFTQKVIRTVWILLHEETMPFIDLLNMAEKIGLVSSADKLLEIRDLRNQIAHEYIPEAIRKLIPDVIELFAELSHNVQIAGKFLMKRKWLDKEVTRDK
ncbi:MAG: hypothetical protein H8E14_02405 [Candidatus Marinimicrobia bacterium]|nr:hypothetical protein [Candidatus Neomarinimicrobiota bacterium]